MLMQFNYMSQKEMFIFIKKFPFVTQMIMPKPFVIKYRYTAYHAQYMSSKAHFVLIAFNTIKDDDITNGTKN